MNSIALEPFANNERRIAVLRGWGAGIVLALAAFVIAALVFRLSQPAVPLAEWPTGILTFLVSLLAAALVVALVSFPAPILALALLWLTERASPGTRSLPAWLAIGVTASLPVSGYVWYFSSVFTAMDERLAALEPFRWDVLIFPLLVLASGLVGAFYAWRYRQRELAQ